MNNSELAVIGSCLVDEYALSYALENLSEEYFLDLQARKSFALLLKARREHIPVDVVTISSMADSLDLRLFIIECAEKVPSALTIQHYANAVKREFFKSNLTKLFFEAAQNPEDPSIQEQIEKTFSRMDEQKNKVKDFKSGLPEYIDLIEKRASGEITSILSGYSGFDRLTGGLTPGEFIVIGARTSKGKSASLINLSMRYFERGERVLYVSSEMVYIQIMDRLMSLKTGISASKLRWHPDKEDIKKVMEASQDFSDKNFLVYEGGFLNLPKIASLISSYKPTIVIVDYIQGFIPQGKQETRAAFYSGIAYSLKALANEYKILILSASQFSRNLELTDREPTLADFKESGGIEEAPDMAILLHQKEDRMDGTRIYDFIIAKNRNGPTGRIPFIFFEKQTRFEEYFDLPMEN